MLVLVCFASAATFAKFSAAEKQYVTDAVNAKRQKVVSGGLVGCDVINAGAASALPCPPADPARYTATIQYSETLADGLLAQMKVTPDPSMLDCRPVATAMGFPSSTATPLTIGKGTILPSSQYVDFFLSQENCLDWYGSSALSPSASQDTCSLGHVTGSLIAQGMQLIGCATGTDYPVVMEMRVVCFIIGGVNKASQTASNLWTWTKRLWDTVPDCTRPEFGPGGAACPATSACVDAIPLDAAFTCLDAATCAAMSPPQALCPGTTAGGGAKCVAPTSAACSACLASAAGSLVIRNACVALTGDAAADAANCQSLSPAQFLCGSGATAACVASCPAGCASAPIAAASGACVGPSPATCAAMGGGSFFCPVAAGGAGACVSDCAAACAGLPQAQSGAMAAQCISTDACLATGGRTCGSGCVASCATQCGSLVANDTVACVAASAAGCSSATHGGALAYCPSGASCVAAAGGCASQCGGRVLASHMPPGPICIDASGAACAAASSGFLCAGVGACVDSCASCAGATLQDVGGACVAACGSGGSTSVLCGGACVASCPSCSVGGAPLAALVVGAAKCVAATPAGCGGAGAMLCPPAAPGGPSLCVTSCSTQCPHLPVADAAGPSCVAPSGAACFASSGSLFCATPAPGVCVGVGKCASDCGGAVAHAATHTCVTQAQCISGTATSAAGFVCAVGAAAAAPTCVASCATGCPGGGEKTTTGQCVQPSPDACKAAGLRYCPVPSSCVARCGTCPGRAAVVAATAVCIADSTPAPCVAAGVAISVPTVLCASDTPERTCRSAPSGSRACAGCPDRQAIDLASGQCVFAGAFAADVALPSCGAVSRLYCPTTASGPMCVADCAQCPGNPTRDAVGWQCVNGAAGCVAAMQLLCGATSACSADGCASCPSRVPAPLLGVCTAASGDACRAAGLGVFCALSASCLPDCSACRPAGSQLGVAVDVATNLCVEASGTACARVAPDRVYCADLGQCLAGGPAACATCGALRAADVAAAECVPPTARACAARNLYLCAPPGATPLCVAQCGGAACPALPYASPPATATCVAPRGCAALGLADCAPLASCVARTGCAACPGAGAFHAVAGVCVAATGAGCRAAGESLPLVCAANATCVASCVGTCSALRGADASVGECIPPGGAQCDARGFQEWCAYDSTCRPDGDCTSCPGATAVDDTAHECVAVPYGCKAAQVYCPALKRCRVSCAACPGQTALNVVGNTCAVSTPATPTGGAAAAPDSPGGGSTWLIWLLVGLCAAVVAACAALVVLILCCRRRSPTKPAPRREAAPPESFWLAYALAQRAAVMGAVARVDGDPYAGQAVLATDRIAARALTAAPQPRADAYRVERGRGADDDP